MLIIPNDIELLFFSLSHQREKVKWQGSVHIRIVIIIGHIL